MCEVTPTALPQEAATTFSGLDAYTACCGSRGVSRKGFLRLCKHSGFASAVSKSMIGSIFDQVLPKGEHHVDFQQFKMAVSLLANMLHVKEEVIWQRIEQSGVPPPAADIEQHQQETVDVCKSNQDSLTSSKTSSLRPLCSLSRAPSHTLLSPSLPRQSVSHWSLSSASFFAKQRQQEVPSTRSLEAKSQGSLRHASAPEDLGKVIGALPTEAPQEAVTCSKDSAPAGTESAPFPEKACSIGSRMGNASHMRAQAAEARDALDAAVLFGAGAIRKNASAEQQDQAKQTASHALGLALLAEAREVGIDIIPSVFLKAKSTAQGALDFALLTERNLDIDAFALDELKVHAQDAVRAGLLAMQRAEETAEEALSPSLQSAAPDALEQLLGIVSWVQQGSLSRQSLVEARQAARGAVTRAVTCEAQCCGMHVTPEELQRACQRAYLALDLVTLTEPDTSVNGELCLLVTQQALNALHLAILGLTLRACKI